MTTRRSFLTGLMASAALPVVGPTLPKLFAHQAAGEIYAVTESAWFLNTNAALAMSMRHTRETVGANVLNKAWGSHGR